MADLSGRFPELPLSRRALALILLLGLAPGAEHVSAQEARPVRAFAQTGVRGTRVHGGTVPLVGFGAGLSVSPSFVVGGAGHVLPAPVDMGQVALRGLELTFGYGGIFAEYGRPTPWRSASWFGSLLLGAGNADVSESATSLRLDSDNFFVAEPLVGLRHALPWRLSASATVSWRLVWGVDDLRGVEAADLRSLSLGLGLRLSPL